MHDTEPLEVVPIDGVLDLQTFAPAEVKDVVVEYLDACAECGIFEVRLIHGKGTGALRRTVQVVLQPSDQVAAFRLAGEDLGGWGATIVTLKPFAPSGR